MQNLSIYYDNHCPFCVRCKNYLTTLDALIPLHFVGLRSLALEQAERLPGGGSALLAVDDQGRYWKDEDAFLIVMWSVNDFHSLARAASSSVLRAKAKTILKQLSNSREFLSGWVGCEGDSCAVPT